MNSNVPNPEIDEVRYLMDEMTDAECAAFEARAREDKAYWEVIQETRAALRTGRDNEEMLDAESGDALTPSDELISRTIFATRNGRILRSERSSRAVWLAAAAVLLVCVGAAFVLLQGGQESSPFDAEVARLRKSDPELFAEFGLLNSAQLAREGTGTVSRSTHVALLWPRLRAPTTTPEFCWAQSPGVDSWTLTVMAAEDSPVGVATRTETVVADASEPRLVIRFSSPFPRGARLVWRVEGERVDGTKLGSWAQVEIAARAEDSADPSRDGRLFPELKLAAPESYLAQRRKIADETSPPARGLLQAHLALRADILGDAVRWLVELGEKPEAGLARETWAYILRQSSLRELDVR